MVVEAIPEVGHRAAIRQQVVAEAKGQSQKTLVHPGKAGGPDALEQDLLLPGVLTGLRQVKGPAAYGVASRLIIKGRTVEVGKLRIEIATGNGRIEDDFVAFGAGIGGVDQHRP